MKKLSPPDLRLDTRTQTLFVNGMGQGTLAGTAREAYFQGANAMLKMFKEAKVAGDLNALMNATKSQDFWAKVWKAQVDHQD